ncbi:MAG: alpha/beta hydrolase [bacterium]|nr:alpha/beta hydrolase [bacterium]
MADGDYERGRGREIASIAAHLKRLAAARSNAATQTVSEAPRPGVLVLNGWAASPQAWDLCGFAGSKFQVQSSRFQGVDVRLFSYIDQLDGLPERFLSEPGANNQAPATKFILVGWSMGGSSALRLACQFPDRVAGLVLLAATPRMMEVKETGWRGMSPRRLDALRKGLELTHGEGFFGVPEGKPNPYMVDVSENLERGLRYLLETDIRADLERVFPPHSNIHPFSHSGISFPVHIFQSERDGIVRSDNAAYLKTIFPQAQLTMVPGTEHALPIQIPKEIDDAVDACLAVAAKG